MDEYGKPIIAIFTSIVGLTILAVLVSKNSNTSSVIGTVFQGFGSILNTAVSPVTGGSTLSGVGSIAGIVSGISNTTGFSGYGGSGSNVGSGVLYV